jgi:type II secretory pathway pseudopilin PulG
MRLRRKRTSNSRAMRSSARPDGFSFIEVLVSIVLLGTAGVAVLAALGSSIRGSVTHEEKVRALSALESAAAGLQRQVDPCTDTAYTAAARAAVVDTEWANSLEVEDLLCGAVLHELRLTVEGPRGLREQLGVTIGGPRVVATDDDDPFDDTSATILSCVATGIQAAPDTAELSDLGLLPDDVLLEVTTDAACSGTLRARFTPAPTDPNTGLAWEPPLTEVSAQLYTLVLTEGTFAWPVGAVDIQVRNEQLTGSTAAIGSRADFFSTTCGVTVSVDDPAPSIAPDGRLAEDLDVTVTLSPWCPAPSGLELSVQTGAELFAGPLLDGGGTWGTSIPGSGGGGPVFTVGPKTIEVSSSTAGIAGVVEIEVVP